jgi:hypothetical protein
MIKNYINLITVCRVFVYFSAFYLFLMTFLKHEIDIILLTVFFIIITLILLEMILSYISIIQTALLVVLLFCFGFYLKLGLIIYDPFIFGYSGFTSLGNFNFEFNQLFQIYLVTIISTIGILIGLSLSTKNCTVKILNANTKYSRKEEKKKRYISIFILFWFIQTISFFYLIDYLELGKHGIAAKEDYPPFVIGILVFIAGLYNIGMIFCLYDILIKNSSNSIKFFFIICISLLLGLILFKITLSRSVLIFMTLPFVLSLIYQSNKKMTSHKPIIGIHIMLFFLFLLGLYLFSMGYLEQKRALAYSMSEEDMKIFSIFDLLKLLIIRIEGARELFLVIDYPNKGIEAYINANTGRFSPADELYHFSLEGTAFGITLGFQGLSYLSGSYFVTLIHSLIFFFILAKVEIFFRLRGLPLFSSYITIILTTLVWMNMDLYSIFQYSVIICLIYISTLVIKLLFKKTIK